MSGDRDFVYGGISCLSLGSSLVVVVVLGGRGTVILCFGAEKG